MIKVETLIYEYDHCLECRHCGFNHWHHTEYIWGCDLMDKSLEGLLADKKLNYLPIPKWCPLPTKEED